MTTDTCTCAQCAIIHAEFIEHFGRFPKMTHQEALELHGRRIANEESWNRALR